MKKVLAVILALVMVVATGVYAFAANNFVSSPSGRPVPGLIIGENTDEDCFAWLKITSFLDRHTLDEEKRDEFENAYQQVLDSEDLSDLNSDLKTIADALGIPTSALLVSDFFDISWFGCDDHRDHDGYFRIQIQPELLNNFVALMHYYNGEWVIVDSAEVIGDGDILSFKVDDLSPFAIVVNEGDSPIEPPFGGDNTMLMLYVALMAVSGIALVVVGVKIKRERKNSKV
ncbi:MAG: hypothetical protein IKU25_03115 [Clostridia bacterium]|nr:hypothetical protein [Clostridia bacterium]